MKYMISWKIPPGKYVGAAERFLHSGAPVPEPLTLVGRWHAPGSMYGWALIEGDDPIAMAQHSAEWARYLEIQVTPVLDDYEASAGISKVYGSP